MKEYARVCKYGKYRMYRSHRVPLPFGRKFELWKSAEKILLDILALKILEILSFTRDRTDRRAK